MRIIRILILLSLVLTLAGCAGPVTSPATDSARLAPAATPAPGDSTPAPPPPASPDPIPPVRFAGWDTTRAGLAAITRWQLGNESDAPYRMQWSLHGPAGWPGYPTSGTVDLAPFAYAMLEAPTPVPAGTPPGMYELLLTVTRPLGIGEITENGAIRVP